MAEKAVDTEQKIKEAARILFQQKGFAATKTREIAEAADINLALLNYYFRSKQKLYEIIMTETMQTFFGGLINLLNDQETTVEEKIQAFVDHYINLLNENSSVPHFILNTVRENPQEYVKKIGMLDKAQSSFFFQQFLQASTEGKIPGINPLHFFLNLMSLVAFPFLAKPMLQVATDLDEEQFAGIMNERRRLIPLWIKEMLTVS